MNRLSKPQFKPTDFAFIVFAELNQQFSTVAAKRSGFAITEGAITAFTKYGIQATTLAQISRSSGVKSPTIVYHFNNLQNLKLQTMKYCRLLYQSFVIRKMAESTSVSVQFDKYLEASIQWPRIFKKHSQFWIQSLAVSVSDDLVRETNTAAVDGGRSRLVNFIQAGVDQKVFDCKSSEDAASTIHLLMTGYLLSSMTQDKFDDYDGLRQKCRAILGLKS